MHAMTWVATGTKVCLRVRPLLRLEEDDVNVLRMVRGCVTLKTRSFRRLVNLQAPGLLIKVGRHNKIGGGFKNSAAVYWNLPTLPFTGYLPRPHYYESDFSSFYRAHTDTHT